MTGWINYIRDLTNRAGNFIEGVYDLQYQTYNDALIINDRINKITNRKLKDWFPEIYSIRDFALESAEKISNKVKNLTGIFSRKSIDDKIPQNIANEHQPNYSTTISYLSSYLPDKTAELSNLLSGNKAWKWETRAQLAFDYLNNNNFTKADYSGMLRIRDALMSNSYLQKKHNSIFRELDNKLDTEIWRMSN